MILDPTTNIGKIRLRVADYSDLPIFPDSVYQSALDECNNYLPRAAVLMAQYILASLTCRTHQRMVQLEIWDGEYFTNYLAFVKATILNPNLMQIAPTPYGASTDTTHPIIQFQKDWNLNWSAGTQTEQMHITAIGGFLSTPSFGL